MKSAWNRISALGSQPLSILRPWKQQPAAKRKLNWAAAFRRWLTGGWKERWAGRALDREVRLVRMEAAIAALQDVVAQLQVRVGDQEDIQRAAAPLRRAGLTANLGARSQALKMTRQGKRPEQIAAALGVPRGEILLLAKLQQTAETSSALFPGKH